MSFEPVRQRNQDATIYIGNLDGAVTEELLCELFVQAGPVVNVFIPRDKVTAIHMGYGFVEFRTEEDAEYAQRIMNMLPLFGKSIKVNKSFMEKKLVDIGANIFIGNLDPLIDEKMLYDTFSTFGAIVTGPRIQRDTEDLHSEKGCGFIGFGSFEAADLAIRSMDTQYFGNRQINVSYAYKKGGKPGERHGSEAERLLAKALRDNPGRNPTNTASSTVPRPSLSVPSPAVTSYTGFPVSTWPMAPPINHSIPPAPPMMMGAPLIPPNPPYVAQPMSMYPVPPPLPQQGPPSLGNPPPIPR